MSDEQFTWLIVGVAGVVLVGTVLWLGGRSGAREVESVAGAKLRVSERNFDWGDIPINGGAAVKEFSLVNEGSAPLQLSNIVTSCACTTARLVKGDERSPEFGMHTKSAYAMEIMPGEQAQLEVVFDPAFHGPNGLGPVTRQVVMNTSDPDHARLEFNLKGVVIK